MRTQAIAMVAAAWLGGVGWSCTLTTELPKASPAGVEGGEGGMSNGTGGDDTTPCDSPTDCPGNETDCTTRTCTDHVCGESNVAPGTPLPSQIAEDCLQRVCSEAGMTTTMPLDSDERANANPCTVVGCSDGAETIEHVPQGTSCRAVGHDQCDGNGHCVECIDPGDCALKPGCANSLCDCSNAECVLFSCLNQIIGELETDEDCGGPDCPPCDVGKDCLVATDCVSQSCGADLSCLEPTCADGVANGSETDLDCGGPCAPCAPGKLCATGMDCDSLVCTNLTCQPPRCDDGVLNSDESDVDCGGAVCGRCTEGKKCHDTKDCRDGLLCKSGKCTLVAIPVPRKPRQP